MKKHQRTVGMNDEWLTYVWGCASAIMFLKGRPHFYRINGERAKANSGCTICLIAYGSENKSTLINSKIGHTIILQLPTK